MPREPVGRLQLAYKQRPQPLPGISALLQYSHRDAAGGLIIYYYFADVTFFFKFSLSFDNGWKGRNADCCVNTVDKKITTETNLVNFGPLTPEILWLICMGMVTVGRLTYALCWLKAIR